jgi:hypothetical protein
MILPTAKIPGNNAFNSFYSTHTLGQQDSAYRNQGSQTQ